MKASTCLIINPQNLVELKLKLCKRLRKLTAEIKKCLPSSGVSYNDTIVNGETVSW